MKKIYTLLLFVIAFQQSKAQYVAIPDTAFVSYLTAKYPSAMSGNLLDTTNSFIVNDTLISCDSKGISDLYGVQFFDKLKYLFCSNNSLTYLPSLPGTLKELSCIENHLTSLPALPSSIDRLLVYDNDLTSLPTLPSALLELNCSDNHLSSLPALPSALLELNCFDNNLSNLPALPSLITTIRCNSNKLTSLPTLPSSLNYLEVSFNHLTSLSTLSSSSIQYLYCSNNSLSILPILPSSLLLLYCGNNDLTSLPLLPTSLRVLYCNNNTILSLPVLPASLGELGCNRNNLTTLPSLPDSLTSLNCTKNALTGLPDLPNQLISLWCDSNNLKNLPRIPVTLKGLVCDNNPSLYCLPAFTQKRFTKCFQVRRNTGISCLPHSMSFGPCISNDSTEFLPVCSILSGCPVMDKFAGNVHEDTSATCLLDSVSNGQYSPEIKLKKYKNGVLDYQVYTNTDGYYTFDGAIGDTIDVMIDTLLMPFSVSCPSTGTRSGSITVTDSVFYNQDFGIKCKGADFGVWSVFGSFRRGSTRPAFIRAGDISQAYKLNCGKGSGGTVTTTISGDAAYVAPHTGALTPGSVSGSTITYTIADFGAIDMDSAFNIELQIATTAIMGSSICIQTVVTPATADINPANDTLTYCGKVVNSFDPNDKLVYPANTITPDEWLTYTINFQNTGTDTAYQVIIRDTLDPYLDLSSFTYLDGSHRPQVNINGHAVLFNFPHINLIDSLHDEPKSHAWIQYKIKSLASLPPYATIRNKASIYFDDNDPIVTNTTSNINTPLSIKNEVRPLKFNLYPNPASSTITINTSETGAFKLLDLLGSVIYQSAISRSNTPINIKLPELAKGLYIYQFEPYTNTIKTGKLFIQ